jgi:hypothetical protein
MSSTPACLPRASRAARRAAAWLALAASASCTQYHSKQALAPEPAQGPPPSAAAHFITEEDSGLSLFGMFVLAEPDHYAVLLERMRRDHRCTRLSYPQLDFYTDHWLLIAFPIARITSLCEPGPAPGNVILPLPAPAPAEAEAPAPAPEPP